MGISEVPEEDESAITYQKNKRVKITKTSALAKTDSEITQEEDGSPSPDLPHRLSTSLDQPVQFEPVSPCRFDRMSGKGVVAGDKISMKVVDSTLLEKTPDFCSGFEKSTSNGDEELEIDNLNGNRDVDMLTISMLEQNTVKLLEENVQVQNMESTVENIDKFPQVSSRDSLHLDHDEQFVASNADPSLSQSCVLNILSSEANARVSVAVDKAFAGYTGKKLLVLDVNGLLVDISSYVPYDYDPDEIILRKAVFKRPYCDDFLKFCFERFNVGVWSSKTKRNMEPILDFLMGKEKSNLLFCWDQSHCTYTGYNTVEKRYKPLLLKKLKKLWDKCEPDLPWERGLYNESNTLLLDDSPYKALCNPRYTAIFPHTYQFRDVKDNSLGPDGELRTYLKGLALAENVQEYVRQNPFGQRSITEKNLSWGFYLKVIEASSSPPHQTANDSKT